MTALPRGSRLAAIVFAALLSGVLVIAAAASAATRATVTASAAKARGCHTHFVGNRAHTDVLRVRDLVVDRGHRVNVGRVCRSAAIARAKAQ